MHMVYYIYTPMPNLHNRTMKESQREKIALKQKGLEVKTPLVGITHIMLMIKMNFSGTKDSI